jgi:hypothetical protein
MVLLIALEVEGLELAESYLRSAPSASRTDHDESLVEGRASLSSDDKNGRVATSAARFAPPNSVLRHGLLCCSIRPKMCVQRLNRRTRSAKQGYESLRQMIAPLVGPELPYPARLDEGMNVL